MRRTTSLRASNGGGISTSESGHEEQRALLAETSSMLIKGSTGPWTPLRPTRSSHGGSSGGSPSQLSSGGASAQLAQSAGKHRRLALAAAAAVVALAAVGTLLALLTPPAVTPPAAPKGPYLTPLGSIYRGPQNPGDILAAQLPSRYEVVEGAPPVSAAHLVHVPGTDQYLVVQGKGCAGGRGRLAAGVWDLASHVYTPLNLHENAVGAGHAVTADGSIFIAGGAAQEGDMPSGLAGVRVLRPLHVPDVAAALRTPGQLRTPRWNPTVTLLPDGGLLVMGGTPGSDGAPEGEGSSLGTNQEYEIWRLPNSTAAFALEPTHLAAFSQNWFPFNWVLPTGDVFTLSHRTSRVLAAQSGLYRRTRLAKAGEAGEFHAAPLLPGPTTARFPFSGTAVMTALRPPYTSAEVVIFGGAREEGKCANASEPAGRFSYRTTVSWEQNEGSAPSYTFSEWVEEDMGIPRVMGDATLLPNGDVVLLNGAQTGCAGLGDARPRAGHPALWAQLYQPDRPAGQRYAQLAASAIPRLSHSTAALTTNGTVLVSGCDDAAPAATGGGAAGRCEVRSEIFHPPNALSALNGGERAAAVPRILSVNGEVLDAPHVGYDALLEVAFGAPGGGARVTAVSLVAPSSATHGFNSHQRVVFLSLRELDEGQGLLRVRTPPSPGVAPPGLYMLYLINGQKDYGAGAWIHLVDKRGDGKRLSPTAVAVA